MNRLFILSIIITTIVSCTEKKSSSLKAFEDLQKKAANDKSALQKLSKRYDSLKSLNRDSPIYVSDIYIAGVDTAGRTQIENKIVDTIAALKEVKNRAEYVKRQTNGQRHLAFVIWQRPTTDQPYYWVKVLEDNGESSYTHYNFYVKQEPFRIFYYDTLNDTILDLSTWRKKSGQ